MIEFDDVHLDSMLMMNAYDVVMKEMDKRKDRP